MKFYDPHPGYGGPSIPLPKHIKEFIDQYDGVESNFEEFEKEFRKIAKEGKLQLNKKHQMITFEFTTPAGYRHMWRLLRIKK